MQCHADMNQIIYSAVFIKNVTNLSIKYNYSKIYYYIVFSVNGMELLIYGVKIRTDAQSVQFLGNAVAALFFYNGTVIKVYFTNRYIDKKLKC